MKLLVTGGAGFIGSNFIRYIFEKYPGYRIINLDKLTYAGNIENLRGIENNPNYRFVRGDICDGSVVNNLMGEVDSVINFAAETHVDRSIADASDFIKTDVFGTYVLLETLKKRKNVKKLVFISTDEVYGSIESGSFKETDSLNPTNPYSASKASSDLLVNAYLSTFKLPVIITRSANNIGPYQYPEKVVPLFITNLMEDKQVPLYGDGLNRREWLYVIDNCRAIDLVLHKGKEGQVYNVSGGNEVSNIELTKMILSLLNKPETFIKYVADRPGHDRRYSIDSTKIKSELGWQPEYDLKKSVKETVKWYLNNKQWWAKIKTRVKT